MTERDFLAAPFRFEQSGQNTAMYSPDMHYRYVLTREWSEGTKLVVIGLNPSTATAEQDDPTIRRCIGYAKRWGFSGLVMLNLFAYRATRPRDMQRAPCPIGPANDQVIDLYAAEGRRILAAWGAHGRFYLRGPFSASRLREKRVDLVCLGKCNNEEPKHPLYIRADAEPEPYR